MFKISNINFFGNNIKIVSITLLFAFIIGCSMLGFKSTEQSPATTSGGAESNVVTFKLEYNGEDQVYVAGSFNDWQATATPMKHEGDYWIKKMELEPGEYQYKFVINGEEWITDPNNSNTVDDGYGGENSQIIVGKREQVKKKETSETTKSQTGMAEFKLEYNGEDQVYIAGSFNDWQATATPMKHKGDYWIKRMNLDPGKYQYKFVINGEKWIKDPNNPTTVDDGYGGENSQITVQKGSGKEDTGEETMGKKTEKPKIKESTEVESIKTDYVSVKKPPPASRRGTTPKFIVHDQEPVPLPGNPPPKYTKFARKAGIEGTVVVRAEVLKDGTIGKIKVVKSLQRGEGGLDRQAVEAVKKWKFMPAKNKGRPVKVWITFPLRFNL